MADSQLGVVMRRLRRTMLLHEALQRSDAFLLEAFVSNDDEAAFEALVHRHGPTVMGVCRRILQNTHDAEDAFQATFLILARKAASLARRDLLSGWLYGVAYRVARRARTLSARRQTHERPFFDLPGKDQTNGALNDLKPILDQELRRLPQAYQVPILLCDLQGKSRREAAEQMGVPEGTLSSRLARGRDLLKQRLARRSLALSSSSLALFLTHEAVAAVPAVLVTATTGAAVSFTTGELTVAALSTPVMTLAHGGLKSLLIAKLQTAAAVLLVAGTLGGCATLVAPYVLPSSAAPTSLTIAVNGSGAEVPGGPSLVSLPIPVEDNDADVGALEWDEPTRDAVDIAKVPTNPPAANPTPLPPPRLGSPPSLPNRGWPLPKQCFKWRWHGWKK